MGHLPYRDELATTKHDASPSHERNPREQFVWAQSVVDLVVQRAMGHDSVVIDHNNCVILNGPHGPAVAVFTHQEWAALPVSTRAELKALGITVEGE